MADTNAKSYRSLLQQLRPAIQAAGKHTNKDAGVWPPGCSRHHNYWEFVGPDKFLWRGPAADAYEARYKGWQAWLEKSAAGDTQMERACDKCQNTGWCHATQECEITGEILIAPKA